MNKVKDAADKVKSSTDQMSTSAKKANDEVTKFDRSAQKTQKSLLSWAKEKYSVLLEAKDKISPILSTIKGGLTSFGRKTWSVTMKAVDLATDTRRNKPPKKSNLASGGGSRCQYRIERYD